MSYAARNTAKVSPKHREIDPDDARFWREQSEREPLDERIELLKEECGNGALAFALRAALEKHAG